MVNFVGKFSPHLPEKTKPIQDLLKSEIHHKWQFSETKKELSSETVLALVQPKERDYSVRECFFLWTGIRSWHKNSEWTLVVFISRCLTTTESNMLSLKTKALAVTWTWQRLSVSGLDFTLRNNHKPLVTLLKSRALDDLPLRILRFQVRLLRFNFNIIHVPGKNLITADALSEHPCLPHPLRTTKSWRTIVKLILTDNFHEWLITCQLHRQS